MRFLSPFLYVLTVLSLVACSSGPKTPDWQMEAKTAMDRAIAAYLEGNSRVEAQEFARARSELSSTGRSDLMARAGDVGEGLSGPAIGEALSQARIAAIAAARS